jgi:hypothetical protein
MNYWIIPPLLTSGSLNLFFAYQKLYRDCRSPLFKPFKSWEFYVWGFVQLALPIVVAFFFCKLSSKPTVDLSLWWNIISVGLFFTVFVNANSDLGLFVIPIDKIYAFLNEIAYGAIARYQTGKITDFQVDLQKELLRLSIDSDNLSDLQDYLRKYFMNDVSLRKDPGEQISLLKEVDRALKDTIESVRINALIALVMKVRPKDCKNMLVRYGCCKDFIKSYFG